MAQKAAKTLASRNTLLLRRTLYLTLLTHALFLVLRTLIFPAIFHSTFSLRSLLIYLLLSAPQLLIHIQFERLGRPTYNSDGSVRRSGEDLDAKGLTEYMWDVTYWTYGCVVLAGVFGDWAWWAWAIVPLYSGWLVWTTVMGARGGVTDAVGVPQPGVGGQSKRQAKMEKRGGQKVSYR